MRAKILFCFFSLIFFFSQNVNGDVIELKGYLGKEEIESASKVMHEIVDKGSQEIIIEVNSSSSDINSVINFVKELYAFKVEKGLKIIVYIDNNAVGPIAIIPFLADDLYISFFASWGDIPLETEEAIPTNILRNTVKSLIIPKHPRKNILNLMASAMSDPSLRIVDDQGWKISQGDFDRIISKEGEALVINHNQMMELGLVTSQMSNAAFRRRYDLQKLQVEEKKEIKLDFIPQDAFEKKLGESILYNRSGTNTIGLIQITEKNKSISQATWIYVKNALDYYKKTKPKFIILELNTPGGEVFAAQKISDALKEMDTQEDIPVVAFVNNWAISAGAMLAYSTRFITVVKDASMGAAAPVFVGEGGKMVEASEKINSALRADFGNRAAFFDRNPRIAEAMVDKDIILVMRHGRIIKLDDEKKIITTGSYPDKLITAEGKLLTLNSDDMIKYKVADILLPPKKLKPITAEEKLSGKWDAGKMLLFQHRFFHKIPGAKIDAYKMDWKTWFLALLASPVVSSMIFLGMILGFYIEINSPGFGVPGSFALLCLFLIVLSSFALEVANVLEIVFLLVGLAFIALDVFLIPTFGILGIVGVAFFFIGLFGMMLPGIGEIDFEFDTQTFNAAGEVFIMRLAWLSGTLVLGIVAIALLGRYVMPSFTGFQRLVLEGHEQESGKGYIAG